MITSTKWRTDRDPLAKGQGVGKALDAYHTKCKPPGSLKKGEDFDAAQSAATALGVAFEKATKKLAKKAKETGPKATIALIKAQTTELGKYRLALQTTWQQECAKVVTLFKAGEGEIEKALKRVTKIESMVDSQKAQTEQAHKTLMKINPADNLKQYVTLRKNVKRFTKTGVSTATLVDSELKGLRTAKSVEDVRSGSWIGVLPADYKKTLGVRFREFTGKLSVVEKKGASIKAACIELKAAAEQVLIISEANQDMTEVSNKAMATIKTAVTKQLAPIQKLVIKKADPYEDKIATPVKVRKTWSLEVVQGHIKGAALVFSRTPLLVPPCTSIPKRAKKLLDTASMRLPKDYRSSQAYATRYRDIKGVIDESAKAGAVWAKTWTTNESKLKKFHAWVVEREVALQKKAKKTK